MLITVSYDVKFANAQGSGGVNWDNASNCVSVVGNGSESLAYAAGESERFNGKYAYRNMAQIEAAAAKTFGTIARYAKGFGIVTNVLTTGYSAGKVINQFSNGGVQNINGWDAADAAVGGLGLYAGYALSIGLASGPIGWGVIATAATIYGVGRLTYDLYHEH